MKGLLSTTLLLCLIVPFLGAWQFLSTRIEQIKEQVHNSVLGNLAEDEKTILTFSKHEAETKLEWEHAHEFEYIGEMYDVINSEDMGDSIKYVCYHDERETAAKNKLRNIIAIALGSTPQNQKSQTHITDFLKTLFPIQPVCFQLVVELHPERKGVKKYQFSSAIYRPIPPSPPPEFS